MRVACLWFDKPTDTQHVAEIFLRLSPQICLRNNEAVFLEIGACRRLYSEEGFFARAQVLLRRLSLTAEVCVANSVPESLVMAKYRAQNLDQLPLESLFDFTDPFKKDVVAAKYVAKLIEALRDLGIHNLGQFKRLPARELPSRFGAAGLLCRQRVAGEVGVLWPRWEPPEVISEQKEFPYFNFYGELEPLLFETKSLLDRIFARLLSRGLKAIGMKMVIACEKTSVHQDHIRTIDFEFLFPQGQTKGTLAVIRERLSREFERRPIRSPLEKVEITITRTCTGAMGQKNFFHNREEQDEQLNGLLARLSETYGEGNIFQAQLTEERLPEKSWQRVPTLSAQTKVDLKGRIPLRPTHLMTPEKIEVTEDFIYVRKKPFKITGWVPTVERLSAGWLHELVDRNYYQVEVDTGSVLWIFSDPAHNFYLHGYFG